MLNFKIDPKSTLLDVANCAKNYILNHNISLSDKINVVVEDEAYLTLNDKSLGKNFKLDFASDKLIWRLKHSGRNSEAVCRAVIGKLESPIVFDATAGLGRESIILASAGAFVYMFERNPIIWLLLNSAHQKASLNQDFLSLFAKGLPRINALGSIREVYPNSTLPKPDVIYYDPMFPQRTKSSLVKKDMRIFHELVGFDEDTTEYADYLCTIAKHHVVVKRPANEDPLDLKARRSSFVDGKACRFDCYYVNNP